MKKLIPLILLIFMIVGCTLGNTPTSKVEELLGKYQRLDAEIETEIDELLTTETLTDTQKDRYRKLIEDQYRNMSYEIKDEIIDNDNATVTVSIEVIDYKKVIQEVETEYASNPDYTVEEFNDSKLDRLETAKEKVTYTLEIGVSKDDDGNWKVDSLSNVDKKKLQGMY